MRASELANILPKCKKVGNGYLSCCPGHDDENPSFSFTDGDNGTLIYHCLAGKCDWKQVITGFIAKYGFDFRNSGPHSNSKKRYDFIYVNYDNQEAHKTVRIERNGNKSCWFEKLVDGKWVKGKCSDLLKPYKYNERKGTAEDWLFLVEGEKKADALSKLGFCVTTTPGGAKQWHKNYAPFFKNRIIIIIPDNDKPGEEYATEALFDIRKFAKTAHIVRLNDLNREGEDIYDWIQKGHTSQELIELVTTVLTSDSPLDSWPDPGSLSDERDQLPDITVSDIKQLVPEFLAAIVSDISLRLNVNAESVLCMLLSALGGLAGGRVCVQPKRNDTWSVYLCCLWGALISRPGNKKTPILKEIFKPLNQLEDLAASKYHEELKLAQPELVILKLKKNSIEKRIKKLFSKADYDHALLKELKNDLRDVASEIADQTPICTRYMTTDATGPKLIEICSQNPAGITIQKDELIGLIRSFDQTGNEALRTLLLEGWSGSGRAKQDRILAGTRDAEKLAITVCGSIQPSPLSQLLSSSEDGFIQRFCMVVNLKEPTTYKLSDAEANFPVLERYMNFCKHISDLKSNDIILRFSDDAQLKFAKWYEENNIQINAAGNSDAFRAHLSKYPSTVCSISAIIFLAKRYQENKKDFSLLEIDRNSFEQAAEIVDSILIPHARYIYEKTKVKNGAESLIDKIKAKKVHDGMTVRAIVRKSWEGLTSYNDVLSAIEELSEIYWARTETLEPSSRGGRPSQIIKLNPKIGGHNAQG